MRPTKIKDIVGQKNVKETIKIIIDSSNKRKVPVGHTLFGGPAGTGKTTFALAMAKELGTNYHKLNGASIRNVSDITAVLENVHYMDVVFIDEIHALKKNLCECLYTVMEDWSYSYRNNHIELPKFTIIGATTEVGTLPKPIRDRFKFVHTFEEYTLDELSQIVMMVFKENGIQLKNMNIAKTIAQTCRGNPRHVVNRTEWIRDYMVSKNKNGITVKETLDAIKMTGFNRFGLTQNDVLYLETLAKNGEIGLKNIEAKTGISEITIRKEIEPFLIKLGIVNMQPGVGRYINKQKLKEFME